MAHWTFCSPHRPRDGSAELSLTSAACKTLYENNVALKTKHEALLSRIPLSPNGSVNSVSSPNLSPRLSRSPLRPTFSLGRSTSESVAFRTSSPEHMLSKSYSYNPHYRRVSVPTVDISFLADQNAELLSKLEKLEAEATSADNAGRRELKRLEKEISVLKEELEKTQAKSDELEEKAKTGFGLGAEKVIEEAWKRKKEREAKISAMRRSTRDSSEGTSIRNFAPDAPSVFRAGAPRQYPGPDLSTLEEVSSFGEESSAMQDVKPPQDQQLIAKLLEKIQELEATNAKILEHQTETTSRLQAVQRETEFMTKVYERLNETEGQLDLDEAEARDQVPSGLVSRFAKSHRDLQSKLLATKVKRQRSFHKHDSRSRGTIVGLFDDPPPNSSTPNKLNLPVPFNESPRNPPRHQSSYSIGSGGLASPALSTLSLYSPPGRPREELSPDGPTGPSLASELGDKWGSTDANSPVRLRPRSLSDVSLFSVPPSPCPISRSSSRTISAQEHEQEGVPKTLPTPPSMTTNSLQLSIEPPTPQKVASMTPHHESLLIGNMSPRFRTARSLRARNGLALDGRYPESLGRGPNTTPGLVRRKAFAGDGASPTPARVPHRGQLLVDAFQVMMDEFDERNAAGQGQSRDADISRSPSPDNESYVDAKEVLDETDREHASANIDLVEGENYSEENSLTIQSQESEVTRSKFGAVMVELWMWLQFVIIMLVFLWAMARKGPKSVLRDTERKRTLSMKRM